ncbi:MAG: M6 family metalloprotease domain-containing protein [Bacteroidales bacterium]|nr:M6 family metalloprotease domain-containing protein [Bacteroidales bacterium]
MKFKTIISILTMTIALLASAGPAHRGPVFLEQPDGYVFEGRMAGDEFYKIITTVEGNAIIKEADGWWYYAKYTDEGEKVSTGHKVGAQVSSEVRSLSLDIPFHKLAENAALKRSSVHKEETPLIRRIMESGPDTKAGTPKTKHGLVILAQFKDVSFKFTKWDFINMLIQKGYSYNGAIGSAKEYFDEQFNHSIEFAFDVSDIVTLQHERAYYGRNGKDGNDENPEQMVVDACRLVDSKIDFARYDDDGDGEVDNVFIFFAGGDEAWGAGDDCIWSHAWYIKSGAGITFTMDGKLIDRYACTSELAREGQNQATSNTLAGIGTFCHEYSHTFGLPDLYDTDYAKSGGFSAGLWGSTSLMDAGNQINRGNTPPYFNAIEREILGIGKPVILKDDGGYELKPINEDGKYYKIESDTEGEYYLIECRSNKRWDEGIGGAGMLVYHVDKSVRASGHSETYKNTLRAIDRWTFANEVNCRPDHQCANLLEADSRNDSFSDLKDEAYLQSVRDIRGIFFPSNGINSIMSESRNGFIFWSGMSSEASVTNIRFGSDDSTILFNVIGFSGTEVPPVAQDITQEVFMDGAIIQFNSSRKYEGEATIVYGRTGQDTDTLKVKPYETGKYAVTLKGLQPDSKTYTASIHFEINGVVGDAVQTNFMTKKSPVVKWPYIYIGNSRLNTDGTIPVLTRIPLKLYNATNAAEIRWKFNGKKVAPEGDGYYQIKEDGTLKAYITWPDGTEEVVMKEITVDY